MPTSPEVLRVVSGSGGGGGGGVPATIPFVGIYWPSSSGSTVEAWEISGGGLVTTAPMSSVSAPFTPSSGTTGNGEATSHPGEMISDRCVLLNDASNVAIAFLNDASDTLAVWDLDASTIQSVSLSPSSGWNRVHLTAADGKFRVMFLHNSSTYKLEIKSVEADGSLVSATHNFGGGTAFAEVRACDSAGAFVYKHEGTGSSIDLIRYGWEGGNVSLGTDQTIPRNGEYGQVAHSVRGVEYDSPGGSSVMSWAQLVGANDGKAVVQAIATGTPPLTVNQTLADVGNNGAPDTTIGQHVSCNSTTGAVWRYQAGGAGYQFMAVHPVTLGTVTGTKRVLVYSRGGDGAAAHVVLIGDYEVSV